MEIGHEEQVTGIHVKCCPFCGGKEEIFTKVIDIEDREGWPTLIYCAECGAQGPFVYTPAGGLTIELLDTWNERHD